MKISQLPEPAEIDYSTAAQCPYCDPFHRDPCCDCENTGVREYCELCDSLEPGGCLFEYETEPGSYNKICIDCLETFREPCSLCGEYWFPDEMLENQICDNCKSQKKGN